MLYKSPVEKHTLELIKNLQQKEYLKNFYLVGGTALALHLHHRKSIDIDLFSNFTFDAAQMFENLAIDFQMQLFLSTGNTIKGEINQVKVDILAHRYPFLHNPVSIEGILTLSMEDIIAMKLNAISTSGQRVKNFIDIYCLLDKYPVANMVKFYMQKYSQNSQTNVLKSLVYFNDVDLTDWPEMIEPKDLKWSVVKKVITKKVLEYARKAI